MGRPTGRRARPAGGRRGRRSRCRAPPCGSACRPTRGRAPGAAAAAGRRRQCLQLAPGCLCRPIRRDTLGACMARVPISAGGGGVIMAAPPSPGARAGRTARRTWPAGRPRAAARRSPRPRAARPRRSGRASESCTCGAAAAASTRHNGDERGTHQCVLAPTNACAAPDSSVGQVAPALTCCPRHERAVVAGPIERIDPTYRIAGEIQAQSWRHRARASTPRACTDGAAVRLGAIDRRRALVARAVVALGVAAVRRVPAHAHRRDQRVVVPGGSMECSSSQTPNPRSLESLIGAPCMDADGTSGP